MNATQLVAELTAQYGHVLTTTVISTAVYAAFRTSRRSVRAVQIAREDVAGLASAVLRSPAGRLG